MLRWPAGWEKDGGRVALTEKILLTLLGTVSKPAMPLCVEAKAEAAARTQAWPEGLC